MFWACKLQTKERWGWSNPTQSYHLSLTGVISTYSARMLTLTATPLHPSTLDFSPFIYPGSSGKHLNAQSLLFTHPSGAGPVWHWAGNGQFAFHGASSVSLFRVCSSRVVVVHLAHLACTTIQRWVPSVAAMRKSQFWWRTHEYLVHWFFMR